VRLFVYGSLMRGEAHGAELEGARFLGAARTAGSYTLVTLGRHPALLPGGETAVTGELYEVDGEHVTRLDEFEEPALYGRRTVVLSDGTAAEAYFLVAPAVGAAVIAGGDWRLR
jgi:gamma-glutamylaminecyclotransferase